MATHMCVGVELRLDMDNALESFTVNAGVVCLAGVGGKVVQDRHNAAAEEMDTAIKALKACSPWFVRLFTGKADLSMQECSNSLTALNNLCSLCTNHAAASKFGEVRERAVEKFGQELQSQLVSGVASIEPFVLSLCGEAEFTEEKARASFILAAKPSTADLISAAAQAKPCDHL